MATTIVFAAASGDQALSLRVEEDHEEVFKAWNRAGERVFSLTESGGSGSKVWINPATVAYWRETPHSREAPHSRRALFD